MKPFYKSMNLKYIIPFIFLFLVACSTGRKAFQKGNYFDAVHTSVERLQSKPNHRKSMQVLQESYPLALDWSQKEIDMLLTVNDPQKWEKTVDIMRRVNQLSEKIRRSPAALKIIPTPKVYTSELNLATERAAEETYQEGLRWLEKTDRQSARRAFSIFERCNNLVKGYKNVAHLLYESKFNATLKVMVEPIPVHSRMFQLSAESFYSQVFGHLNKRYPQQGFIHFYTAEEFDILKLKTPDMVMQVEFYDFIIGAPEHSEWEREITRKAKRNPKDTIRADSITYRAKMKTFTDEVRSAGIVELTISGLPVKRRLLYDRFPGEYVWVNQYAIFAGDEKALTSEQKRMTENRPLPPPPPQAMFSEFTRPIFDQLIKRVDNFFWKYR